MKQQRYDVLKTLIEKGTWKIDDTAGVVQGKYGSLGHVDMFGYHRISATYNNKVYVFGIHEIILVSKGYDLVDKEVSFIDRDITNAKHENLFVEKNGVAAKRSLLKSKGVWRSRLTREQVKLIKNDLKDGMKIKEVAIKYGIKYKTISRIARGETYRNVE